MIDFKLYEGKLEDLPPGYQKLICHIIFDVKMGENFYCKYQIVAVGHKTATPSSLTYSSVVYWYSLRTDLTIYTLNDLNLLECDIQNAYLTAKFREKIWTVSGTEFGTEQGSLILVVRSLYVLKSSGAAFRDLLAKQLHYFGYRPSIDDPDVWMRTSFKPGGLMYYEYVICYVDGVLCISDDPLCTMKGIQAKLKLKGYKIEKLDMYLGAYFSKTTNIDGQECWGISSDKYCMEAVTNV